MVPVVTELGFPTGKTTFLATSIAAFTALDVAAVVIDVLVVEDESCTTPFTDVLALGIIAQVPSFLRNL